MKVVLIKVVLMRSRRLRCEDLFNSRRYGFQLDEEQKGDDQLEIRCAETES